MARPRNKNPRYTKQLGKILAVICCVLLAAAAVVFLIRYFSIREENQDLQDKRNQVKYSADYYKMNVVGEISPDSVNLQNYVPLKQFGEFYLNDNPKMLEQTVELTYNSSVDNKYFIKNKCYSCETDDENHYFFFDNDESNLPFYLKISKNWDKSEWFVLSGFHAPDVNFDTADGITIIKTDDARGLPSRSLSSRDLHRINSDGLASTTDKNAIKKYIAKYADESYVYTDTFDEVKTAIQSAESGYVLVSFKSYNLYQCIGTY